MKSSELSNGENRIALWQLLQNRKRRHLRRHNLGSRWQWQKTDQENFSIGAFYNITKNQDNPIKTVGRDSFLSPKTPKNTSFLGSPSPYILGDTTRPRHITYVLVWSKSDQRRLRKTLHKQTNKQRDKPTDTTKIMVTWPWTNIPQSLWRIANVSSDLRLPSPTQHCHCRYSLPALLRVGKGKEGRIFT